MRSDTVAAHLAGSIPAGRNHAANDQGLVAKKYVAAMPGSSMVEGHFCACQQIYDPRGNNRREAPAEIRITRRGIAAALGGTKSSIALPESDGGEKKARRPPGLAFVATVRDDRWRHCDYAALAVALENTLSNGL